MKRYLDQLHMDIASATENVPKPLCEAEQAGIWAWISEEDDYSTARRKSLEEWTGICKEHLPPHEALDDEQLESLYNAMSNMLDVYNMSIVFQFATPTRKKYQVLRKNFNQELPMLSWHMGFFDICTEKTTYEECLLGEACECKYFDELRAGFIDEDLSPEEERRRMLDIEVAHIKRKYEDDWMKYYPYHLDPDYDDENSNPYDYGMGNDDEEDEDDWWKT